MRILTMAVVACLAAQSSAYASFFCKAVGRQDNPILGEAFNLKIYNVGTIRLNSKSIGICISKEAPLGLQTEDIRGYTRDFGTVTVGGDHCRLGYDVTLDIEADLIPHTRGFIHVHDGDDTTDYFCVLDDPNAN